MRAPEERHINELVARWLEEDIGRGDRTTEATVTPEQHGRARLEARQVAVIAGLPFAEACFRQVGGDELKWLPEVSDGDRVEPGGVLARVEGSLAAILTAERTALNILQRLSAVATVTSRYVEAVKGTDARIVDTREDNSRPSHPREVRGRRRWWSQPSFGSR